jgi:C-terminal processing protease CtpA/Prc
LVVNKLTFDFYRYAPDAEPMPADFFEKQADGTYLAIKHPNWGVLQPIAPFFDGKVIILVNGGSFSTTCEFLAKMADTGRATIVAEESGGGFSGNTSGPSAMLTLPNSKLQIQIPLLGYYSAISDQHISRRGIIPSVSVHYSIEDALNGKDLAMESAERIAQSQQ